MKKFFFENGTDHSSMMRLIAFITVFSGLLIAFAVTAYGMIKGSESVQVVSELITLCFGILGFGFGGKVIQKFGEKKSSEP